MKGGGRDGAHRHGRRAACAPLAMHRSWLGEGRSSSAPVKELWVVVSQLDLANSKLTLSGVWDWGVLLRGHFTLGCGRPIHSEGPSPSGGEGPREVSGPTSCSEQGRRCLQIMLLCPVRCWKPSWLETVQPVRATCPTAQLSLQYVFFP